MTRLSPSPVVRFLLASLLLAGCSSGSGEVGDGGNVFPPEEQEPFFEKGLILPPNSLACVPESTGIPQNDCNHHGSTLTELPDGTIAAAWFHGENEKSHDSRIVWSQLLPGETEWTPPEVLFDEPDKAEGNAAIYASLDGDLLVFFVTIMGRDWWDDSWVRLIRSSDGGQIWSDVVNLRQEYCWVVRHRPLQLSTGEMILPLYDECLALPRFMRSVDGFESWEEIEPEDMGGYLLDHPLQIQPALIERSDGTLVAITRDGGSARRIHIMESPDAGRTWSPSLPTALPNSGTSVDWVRLLDAHVVTVFNNSPDERFPLAAALSTDEGRSWGAVRHLNEECDQASCSYHYPAVMQSRIDGTIWVTYTHERETIGWVHFNEAWLMLGGEQLDVKPIP
jgi:predicted neuraminidase